MKNVRIRSFLALLTVLVFVVSLEEIAFSYGAPDPQSGGKFFKSKGTRANDAYEYEGRPGGPVYEYGKGFLAGPVLLKPAFEYDVRFDNNVFRDENGRKEDWVHVLKPGVRAELPLAGGQHLLTAGYDAEIDYFQRYGNQEHTNQIVTAGLQLNYVPFTLSLADTFARTVDRSNTEFTSRVSRDENTASALLEIPFAAFFLESEVEDYDINYRQPENSVFDYHNFNIYQRVGVDLSPQTQVLAEYGYSNIYYYHPTDSRDGDANQVMLGVRGLLNERISYQLWGGAQWRAYDASIRPDFNDFISRAGLRYDISELNWVTLRFDRNPEESTYDNQSFYVRNKGTVAYKHQIAERLFLGADAAISYNEYSRISNIGGQDRTRRDYVWETGAGLEYFMPNEIVSFFGEYRFSARESDINGLGYDAQTINMGVRARY